PAPPPTAACSAKPTCAATPATSWSTGSTGRDQRFRFADRRHPPALSRNGGVERSHRLRGHHDLPRPERRLELRAALDRCRCAAHAGGEPRRFVPAFCAHPALPRRLHYLRGGPAPHHAVALAER